MLVSTRDVGVLGVSAFHGKRGPTVGRVDQCMRIVNDTTMDTA